MERTYDANNRRATLTPTGIAGASAGPGVTYSHESSRLVSVATSDGYAASQAWSDDGRRPGATVHTQGNTSATMTRTYDTLGRLTFAGVSGQASTAYEYNVLDQRTKATAADGSNISHSYDDLGQLAYANRSWANGSSVDGEQFGYQFDEIGNRRFAWTNGGSETFYQINTLDQLTQAEDWNGHVSVAGMGFPPSSNSDINVWFDWEPGTVHHSANGWFYGFGFVDNQNSAKWVQVDVSMSLYDMVIDTTGHQFVPKAQSALSYDDDGNFVEDQRFLYRWDGENRLVQVETRPEVISAGVPGTRLTFAYDWMSRRVSKTVEDWQGESWVLRETRRFLYDGWNLLCESGADGTLLKRYVWGVDLSGTLEGAAGVGGLLRVSDHGTGSHYAATYDGNGNLTALWNLSGGQQSATFRYGPFGEILESTGEASETTPFGFSTKYRGAESGLLYYGYRFYNPETGRWINRDLIEEKGGINLYGLLANQPIVNIDLLGLKRCIRQRIDYKFGGTRPIRLWKVKVQFSASVRRVATICDDCTGSVDARVVGKIDIELATPWAVGDFGIFLTGSGEIHGGVQAMWRVGGGTRPQINGFVRAVGWAGIKGGGKMGDGVQAWVRGEAGLSSSWRVEGALENSNLKLNFPGETIDFNARARITVQWGPWEYHNELLRFSHQLTKAPDVSLAIPLPKW